MWPTRFRAWRRSTSTLSKKRPPVRAVTRAEVVARLLSTMRQAPTHLVRIVLGSLAGLVVLTFVGYAALLRLEVLPRLGFAPGWALVDAEGERLTSEDLRGHVVLYTFTYTGNQDPRRRTDEVMRAVQDGLVGEDLGGVPVRQVTISFDPERDTPEALRQAAARAGADPEKWLFATGDEASLRTVIGQGFGAFYERRDDGSFAFDPTFVVVDGLSIVRSRYRVGLPSPEILLRDLRSVAREARAATGTARLAYEAAHLFSCYSTVSP